MKINLLILAALCLLGAGGNMLFHRTPAGSPPQVAATMPQPASPARKAPDFTTTAINGRTISLSALSGKTVILNFWATWCPPCVVEFPVFLDVAAKYPDDVVLIALSSDHDEAAVRRFVDKMSAQRTAPVLQPNVLIAIDRGKVITTDLYQSILLPETVIIGPSGDMVAKLPYAVTEISEIERLLPR